jgi:hypothetical protein
MSASTLLARLRGDVGGTGGRPSGSKELADFIERCVLELGDDSHASLTFAPDGSSADTPKTSCLHVVRAGASAALSQMIIVQVCTVQLLAS